MVVASSKLEGLADALEMTDVIIETAKQLKASLNQAKKGTPRRARGRLRHPRSLAYRRQLLARRPHPAQQVRPQVASRARRWVRIRLPRRPHLRSRVPPRVHGFPTARQEDRHRTRRRRVRRRRGRTRAARVTRLARAQSRRATGVHARGERKNIRRRSARIRAVAPRRRPRTRRRGRFGVPSRKPRVARARRRRRGRSHASRLGFLTDADGQDEVRGSVARASFLRSVARTSFFRPRRETSRLRLRRRRRRRARETQETATVVGEIVDEGWRGRGRSRGCSRGSSGVAPVHAARSE